jgi:Dipeptidyl peptidase IV (DPP IV) N-terminal region
VQWLAQSVPWEDIFENNVVRGLTEIHPSRMLGQDGEEGDEGWVESEHTVYPLPPSFSTGGLPSYLDIVPDKDGYNHIALFSPASTSTPRFLTIGLGRSLAVSRPSTLKGGLCACQHRLERVSCDPDGRIL